MSIRPEFQTWQLNEHGQRVSTEVRTIFSNMLDRIEVGFSGTPLQGAHRRELAIARTHLEDAAMRVQRAIAQCGVFVAASEVAGNGET